jgi:AcrR family transcriptional regulator
MEVRAQILTQATRLFAKLGYDGTSVQQIADAVGIRKPSLLYHFKSKDELRENVLAEMLAHWNAVLPGLLLKASTEERFDATMEALSEFFIEDPDRARLFLRETLDRPARRAARARQGARLGPRGRRPASLCGRSDHHGGRGDRCHRHAASDSAG